MDTQVVRAKERPFTGKGFARKIRALGYLPGVLYGRGVEPVSLVVDPKVLVGILSVKRANALVQLEVEGEKNWSCLAVIRDYSYHPVKRVMEHVDFLRVNDDTELLVKVPVRTIGKAEGEKFGGRLNVAMRNVALKCKATHVPDEIVIDVTPFQVGQVMNISQLPLPEGARPVFIKDNAVITCRLPRDDKGAEAAEGEATPAAAAAAPAAAAAAPAAAAKPEAKK